jgi:hypothetical protein
MLLMTTVINIAIDSRTPVQLGQRSARLNAHFNIIEY